MNWKELLSVQRIGKKADKTNASRSVFEQDFDRIIFSQSFRSLQDKTQVFPLAGQEFAHTRLTHSLEVSSVGRSLGREVGAHLLHKYPELREEDFTSHDFGAIVAAAALAHDIGNPPFGHAGEAGISEFMCEFKGKDFLQEILTPKQWHDVSNFEGNAQGFRLLNKSKKQGLQLSLAILGAFSKYPRESFIDNPDQKRKSQNKYGFLQSGKDDFTFVAEQLGLISFGDQQNKVWCRHPLTFLVEAADDICYTIIDLEDGTNQNWLSFDETEQLLGELIGEKYQPEKLSKYQGLSEKTGMLRAMAISVLIRQVVQLFLDKEPEIMNGTFDQALCDLIPSHTVFQKIQEVSVEKIYRSKPVIEREVAGFEVLHGLLEAFMPGLIKSFRKEKMTWKEKCMIRLLPPDTRFEIANTTSLYEQILYLLDFVSGLTDSKALSLFRNIKGISIPGSFT